MMIAQRSLGDQEEPEERDVTTAEKRLISISTNMFWLILYFSTVIVMLTYYYLVNSSLTTLSTLVMLIGGLVFQTAFLVDTFILNNMSEIGLPILSSLCFYFRSGMGSFLQSSEQGIALQSTVGAGIGRYFKNTNRTNISLVVGPAWQNTEYKQSVVASTHQNVAAALFYGHAEFFKFSKTNLDVTLSLLPALSEPGRFRFNTEASYYIKIVSDLKWNVSFYGNWDNRPPTGFSGSDYGTSSGLSWTFGLK